MYSKAKYLSRENEKGLKSTQELNNTENKKTSFLESVYLIYSLVGLGFLKSQVSIHAILLFKRHLVMSMYKQQHDMGKTRNY